MRFVLVALICLLPLGAAAQDLAPLRGPGVIALMRHAVAPGTGDPGNFRLGDCSTQRNLDERGRAQARRTGAALRAAGIGFDAVWASQWCRTTETAELLGIGPVRPFSALNSFFAGRGDRAAQTRATLEALNGLSGTPRLLLVTHQVNITALSGVYPKSGEIVVTRRDGAGGLEVVGRVLIAP